MKTKKLVLKAAVGLLILIPLCLNSCEKEQWCVDCEWICTDIDPWFGGKSKTICAGSRQECEAEFQDWYSGRFMKGCWDCTEPYIK